MNVAKHKYSVYEAENVLPARRVVLKFVTASKLLRKMAHLPKYPAHRRRYR